MIRELQTLRVLTLSRDGSECGPHRHSALERSLLEAIQAEEEIEIAWVCVATEEELAPALLQNLGDLVLHDLSSTPDAERVAFTLPQVVTRLWLVTPPGKPNLSRVDDLAGLRVAAVRHGNGWGRLTEWQQQLPAINVVGLPKRATTHDLATGLANGEFDAALVSSTAWEALDGDRLAARIAFDAGDAPPVRWAVRPDALELLALVDRHLSSVQLVNEPAPLRRGDLADIRRHRILRVLTRQRPGSFYLERGELHGFEYELLRRFAGRHGMTLEIVVPPADQALTDWLADGRGDVIGSPLAPHELAGRGGVTATRPYRNIQTELVGRSGRAVLASPEALAGQTVAAERDSLAWSRLHELRAAGVDVEVVDVAATAASADLLDGLVSGKHALVAVSAPLPRSRGIASLLTLGEPSPRVWATRTDNPTLLAALDEFIQEEYRGVDYNVLERRYARRHSAKLTSTPAAALSPYDALVRELADEYGFDWRLIVAQMFQESRFDPTARSHVGAQGLMQVMPATGRELGFTDLHRPEDSVRAGIMYLAKLRDRFGRDLPVTTRLRFALAAYNAGYGRVSAARKLAAEMGLDPDRWFGHVELALYQLPRSKSAIARGHRRCRCGQPVNYVREIQVRYAAYARLGGESLAGERVAQHGSAMPIARSVGVEFDTSEMLIARK